MDWGRGGRDTALGKQGPWGKMQEHAEVAGGGVGAVGEHRLRQRANEVQGLMDRNHRGAEGEQSREKMQWRWSEGHGVTSEKEVQASHGGES